MRAIRNLVAGAVPELKAERVSITDQQGELLAAEGDGAVDGAGGGERNQVEERIRRTVKDMVEGIVGPGHARVQVSADLDMSSHTTSSEKFDPDGQVVRSTQTSDEKSAENKANSSGATTASQNVPGAAGGAGSQSRQLQHRQAGRDHQLRDQQDHHHRRAAARLDQAPVGGRGRGRDHRPRR